MTEAAIAAVAKTFLITGQFLSGKHLRGSDLVQLHRRSMVSPVHSVGPYRNRLAGLVGPGDQVHRHFMRANRVNPRNQFTRVRLMRP
jgi:hypothetical protein